MSSDSNDSYQGNENERRAQIVIKLKDIPEPEKTIFVQLLSGNYNEAYKSVFQNYSDIKYNLRGMYHICYYLKDYSSFTEDQAVQFIKDLKRERIENYPDDTIEQGYLNVINNSNVQVKCTFLDKLFGYEVNINTTNNSFKLKTDGRKTPYGIRSDLSDVSTVSAASESSNDSNKSIYYRESLANVKKRKNRKPIIVTDLGYDPNEVLARLNQQKTSQGDSSPEQEGSSPDQGGSSPDQGGSSPESQGSYPSSSKAQKREPILLSSIYNYTLANQSYITSIYDMEIDLIIEQAKQNNASEETIENLLKQQNDIERTMQPISSSYRGGYYKTRKRNRKKRKNKSKKHYKKK